MPPMEVGYRSVENRVSVPDLHATLLHLLGLDHDRLTYSHHGGDETLTDARVTGAPRGERNPDLIRRDRIHHTAPARDDVTVLSNLSRSKSWVPLAAALCRPVSTGSRVEKQRALASEDARQWHLKPSLDISGA